ncbi:hypothetical protein [Staphylococcus epidermidis]
MQTIQYLISSFTQSSTNSHTTTIKMLRYSLRTASHTVKLAEELSY